MMLPLFLGTLGLPEMLVIAGVITLIWGAPKIPMFMGNLGKGMMQFKRGLSADTDLDADMSLLDEKPKPRRRRKAAEK
jgi:sec-independent protein translocase protein TatA